jgi:hypothetical protein
MLRRILSVFSLLKWVKLCFLVFLFSPQRSQAQALGSWNVINLKYKLSESWSVFGEAQIRSLKFYRHFHYYEYKAGVSLKIQKYMAFTLGAGSYQTFKEGGDFIRPKNNNEFRIWPQVSLFQTVGAFKIEQRYRTELRFTSQGYKNRFRYRFGVSLPFGKPKEGARPFQVGLSNELFFTNSEPYFERNRLLLAFTSKVSRKSSVQVGYLHQFDYKINDETGRDFLQIGYFIEFSGKGALPPVLEIKDN